MIWDRPYDTIYQYRAYLGEDKEAIEILYKTLAYAKENLTNGYFLEEDDFIVIKIENTPCIAKISNDWDPKEICDRVFPFNKKRFFPYQEIVEKIVFKRD